MRVVLIELGKLAAKSLLLVVLLAAGLRFLRRGVQRQDGQHLALLATLSLGPGKSVHLVRVVNQVYLVGSADKALALLDRLPAGQAASARRAGARRARSPSPGRRGAATPVFLGELRRALGKTNEA
ncbi:MAG: flagellar biosynthetic protein FliO [bacterium]|nr:flagellar biosynthetic protein FliO [bacterium]